MPGNLIKIDPRDNVAVSLTTLVRGDVVNIKGEVITILTEVPAGHKVSLKDIKKGEAIVKYGQTVGKATEDISKGAALHIFNMAEDILRDRPYVYDEEVAEKAKLDLEIARSVYDGNNTPRISGYLRPNDTLGIRNELWFISLAPETEEETRFLASWANENLDIKDGAKCWQRLSGGNVEMAEHLLANIAKNPNAGGVIVVAEDMGHAELFKALIENADPERFAFCTVNDPGTIKKEAERIAATMKEDRKTSVPMTYLTLGVKCSGSDGLSGITANPLAGAVLDELITIGGSGLLSETAEMFGAEHLLLDRCESKEVFEKLSAMLEIYKDHVRSIGKDPYEKLTMENRRGGITTITERSFGCIQKGGKTPVSHVLKYDECVTPGSGLNIIPGPTSDEISVQLDTAAGCQAILFTTGDGAVPDCPTPLVVISTRNAITEKNRKNIDFNAGVTLKEDRNAVTERLMSMIIEIASGERYTKNERA